MEEAHATGAAQAGVAASAAERGATGCASCLEEAWHWGFELDCWRAHLGPLTWPEILRQWAIAAGVSMTQTLSLGCQRSKAPFHGEVAATHWLFNRSPVQFSNAWPRSQPARPSSSCPLLCAEDTPYCSSAMR